MKNDPSMGFPGSRGPVGVVLAGGSSSRLGQDKARLRLGSESLVERAARTLGQVVATVVVADAGRRYLPELASLADGPGRGPAAGLLAAAERFPGRSLLALACDLPWLPATLLAELAAGDADLAWPDGPGGREPLAARYGPAALRALADRVRTGRFALHELGEVTGLKVLTLSGPRLARHGDPARMFLNLNRAEDLARLRAEAP